MPLPIVLIHGYSSEGRTIDGRDYDAASIEAIYGSLPSRLQKLNTSVIPVNLGRYISLDDGLSIDDISFAFDRRLRQDFPDLLASGFDMIVHSTGALVARNWIRRFATPGACPIRHLIHLAGANLGSGWAHIGSGQLAKYGRAALGTQRGLAVLTALEFASDWTLNLHEHFLKPGTRMVEEYRVLEFCLIGSQTPPEYTLLPIRYGKEDGSDGVVRVAASNLNFHFVRLGPATDLSNISWDEAAKYASQKAKAAADPTRRPKNLDAGYYRVTFESHPSQDGYGPTRALVPFAIPYQTTHSDHAERTGIVSGSSSQDQIDQLIRLALESGDETYSSMVSSFDEITGTTYRRVRDPEHSQNLLVRGYRRLADAITNPQAQYDPHSQLIVRARDQHGAPVPGFNFYLNSFGGSETPKRLINRVFEDKHLNRLNPHCICFYLRTESWNDQAKDWLSQLEDVGGVDLEIDAVDPETNRVLFIPLRIRLDADTLLQWIRPHRTTILDVELIRLPTRQTFILKRRP